MSDWCALETMKNTFSGEIAIFGTFDMPQTFRRQAQAHGQPAGHAMRSR
jgi:hypothetical protein